MIIFLFQMGDTAADQYKKTSVSVHHLHNKLETIYRASNEQTLWWWENSSWGRTIAHCHPDTQWLCVLYSGIIVLFLSSSASLLPASPSSPHPGGSDGWYHHGHGAGPAWAALLPPGRLRELPSSGRSNAVLHEVGQHTCSVGTLDIFYESTCLIQPLALMYVLGHMLHLSSISKSSC